LANPRQPKRLEDRSGNASESELAFEFDRVSGFWISPVGNQPAESPRLIIVFDLSGNYLPETGCHSDIGLP
jgi:hypothetical protein